MLPVDAKSLDCPLLFPDRVRIGSVTVGNAPQLGAKPIDFCPQPFHLAGELDLVFVRESFSESLVAGRL